MTDPDRRTPAPARPDDSAVDAFLSRVAAMPQGKAAGQRGQLLFALDATASRQPTWDRASHLQADMFSAAAGVGGLEVQLVFYRGFRECKTTPWISDPADMIRRMTGVTCLGGQTQIYRVLSHALKEGRAKPVNAVVFVGDACEEDPDPICHLAGELGLLGVPVFMFQEGQDPVARTVFQQVAKLSRGAWCPFDASSAQTLKDLLSAVAVFAAGGRKALQHWGKGRSAEVLRLTHQLG